MSGRQVRRQSIVRLRVKTMWNVNSIELDSRNLIFYNKNEEPYPQIYQFTINHLIVCWVVFQQRNFVISEYHKLQPCNRALVDATILYKSAPTCHSQFLLHCSFSNYCKNASRQGSDTPQQRQPCCTMVRGWHTYYKLLMLLENFNIESLATTTSHQHWKKSPTTSTVFERCILGH